ncbi:hypothetical protein HZA42_01550 [Candidatus Peregrinibacteria bacterium]|nr:hypothetical protein [Candidatus Peregrinibacteria bacterium]
MSETPQSRNAVLIVEEDDGVRHLIGMTARAIGSEHQRPLEVLEADTKAEGLRLVAQMQNRLLAVLADLEMHGDIRAGVHVANIAAELGIPHVGITTGGTVLDLGREAPGIPVLDKPDDMEPSRLRSFILTGQLPNKPRAQYI